MATPRGNSYSAASGAGIYAGKPPAWASALARDAFTELSGTDFLTWANANIPAGAYQGTNPFGAIVDAFGDPAFDSAGAAQFFHNGGHGDGTCNAVVKFDHRTLTYSLTGLPTPPAKYPPSYVNGGSAQPGPLTYPSGLAGQGFFLDSDLLTAPEDAAYATPLARATSHMYAAAAMRGTKVFYFYATYAEFDTATGLWSGRGVDIGAQLFAISSNYNAVNLQQGTVAVYDEVTDRFYVTINPGDNGGGWRNHLMEWNPTTRTIVALYGPGSYGTILNSVNICRVGRKLYVFLKTGPTNNRDMNSGFIFDMDTKAMQRFTLTGDTAGSYFSEAAVGQETIPSFYDGKAIRRWNHNSTHRGRIYSVSLTPISGTGTPADPFVLQQTVRNISGVGSMSPIYVYKRIVWSPLAGCALIIPRANQNWRALKLS